VILPATVNRDALDVLVHSGTPFLALAPMQDITDLAFWRLIMRYGGPDLFFTEYFRVYAGSRLDRRILESITRNPTGRPVVAQLIGNDVPELVRSARELQRLPLAAIDLNLGCPAPVVYRKCAGGGLLREPGRIEAILGALRDSIPGRFTVKTRLGFGSARDFGQLLPVYARSGIDLLTVHGRTVADGYRSAVDYGRIREAVQAMPCPVLANGNICSAVKGIEVLRETAAAGLMIGRGAIRNPWMFAQFRQAWHGQPVRFPTGREVLDYLHALFEALGDEGQPEASRVTRMKKHLNFIGIGVEPTGQFLHDVRRVTTTAELFEVSRRFLDHQEPMPLEPFALALKDGDLMAGVHQ
jgi:tRNA-dihydrouridine synthase B